MEILINNKKIIFNDNSIIKINSISNNIEILEEGFNEKMGQSIILNKEIIQTGSKCFQSILIENKNKKRKLIVTF